MLGGKHPDGGLRNARSVLTARTLSTKRIAPKGQRNGTIDMAQKKMDFDVVREIATAFEDVQESTTYGAPSFKVGGKLMVCPAINKSAEPNSLAVCVGFDHRDELIAAEPRVYYLTDHYADHPYVLVRLSEIRRDSLQGLLRMAWQFVSAKSRGRGSDRSLQTPGSA